MANGQYCDEIDVLIPVYPRSQSTTELLWVRDSHGWIKR